MSKLCVGDKLPEFTVNTIYENSKNIYNLLGEKTIIWVLRYIGCSVCHYDVQVAANRYAELSAKGVKIIFVMQSDQTHLVADYPKGSIPFDIISDPTQSIYKALEILPAESMEKLLGPHIKDVTAKGSRAATMGFEHGDYEGNEQQLPAMFIIDREGKVLFAKYAENIIDLPDFDGVLGLI